mmetsp:Transcript_55858/g.100378  ORF Transcript_55858/g.100378 Transcript_55858/m.100378 type:complete len:244 (-) Transcript_55858:104-835(-)
MSAPMIMSNCSSGKVSCFVQSSTAVRTMFDTPFSAAFRRTISKATASLSVIKTSDAPCRAAEIPATPTPLPSSSTFLSRKKEGQWARNWAKNSAEGHTPVATPSPVSWPECFLKSASTVMAPLCTDSTSSSSSLFMTRWKAMMSNLPAPKLSCTRSKPSSSAVVDSRAAPTTPTATVVDPSAAPTTSTSTTPSPPPAAAAPSTPSATHLHLSFACEGLPKACQQSCCFLKCLDLGVSSSSWAA